MPGPSASDRARLTSAHLPRRAHQRTPHPALREGIAPEAPKADDIPRGLLGDTDPAAVLERLEAASTTRLACYRELSAVMKRLEPQPSYAEEFSWVVAALRARAGG